MKKYDKEIAQAQLDNEKAVLKKLESNYADALEEINSKIAELMGRADADMQHVIYQVEYQKNLKKQVETILETLHSNEFETVSEYLTKCYDEGFLGALYSLQSQGVPLAIPINQEEIVAAIQHETKLSTSLYEAFDMKDLQKKIASEISRGFSTGAMYSEIARNISAYTNVSKNKAMRIARTEGHRITETAAYNAQLKAKDRGADIVKIWDAALDAKTRPSHTKVDGEIKELDKKFSNGLMYPGDPNGSAAEVVNCRCRSRSDARWALESDQTKMLGKVSEMSDKCKKEIADKLGISVEDLEQYSGQIVPIKAKNYSDFKKQYDRLWHYEGSDLQAEAEERIASYGKKGTDSVAKAGKVEANGRFVNKNEKLYRYAEKITPFEDYEDFTCHADPDKFYVDIKGKGNPEDFVDLSPDEYAEAIKNSNSYKGGKIRIISCQAGEKEDGAAQRLADAMNVDVYAPTETVYIDENGNMFVSNNDILAELWYNSSQEERKKFTETGKWVLFKPRKG